MRVYADTSVFGGCFDTGFEQASNALFLAVAAGHFTLLVSTITIEELLEAPEKVRAVLDELSPDNIEFHEVTAEIEVLKQAYIDSGVLGKASDADAMHVALATVVNADVIVSWNFKHIVHYEKIRGFNAVNRLMGYKEIEIYSPLEVIDS